MPWKKKRKEGWLLVRDLRVSFLRFERRRGGGGDGEFEKADSYLPRENRCRILIVSYLSSEVQRLRQEKNLKPTEKYFSAKGGSENDVWQVPVGWQL